MLLEYTSSSDTKWEAWATNGINKPRNQIDRSCDIQHTAELPFGFNPLGNLVVPMGIFVRSLVLQSDEKLLAGIIRELQNCVVVFGIWYDTRRCVPRLDLGVREPFAAAKDFVGREGQAAPR